MVTNAQYSPTYNPFLSGTAELAFGQRMRLCANYSSCAQGLPLDVTRQQRKAEASTRDLIDSRKARVQTQGSTLERVKECVCWKGWAGAVQLLFPLFASQPY